MARAEDIGDEGSLRAWLADRSNSDNVKLALRAAQRAAPTIWKSPNLDLRSTDASGLPFLRALLTAGVASRPGTPAGALSASGFAERGQGAASQPDIADAAHHAAARQAVASVVDAIPSMGWADHAGTQMHSAGAVSAAIFVATTYAEDDLEWELLRSDALHIEAGRDPSELPLYPDEAGRAAPRAIDAIQTNLGKDPVVWDFWLRWWDGVLSGRQLPWDLQEKVALIPDEVWKAGPVAVAERIRLIEEQMRLLGEAERLKVELAAARNEVAALSKRSHNNPPELVEPFAEIERQAGEIAEALEAAAEELKQDAPRAAVLRRAGAALVGAAGKSLAYCASLGDVALKKAAEETGSLGAKALIGAGLLAWMSQLEAVKTLGRALEAFAKLLGG